ncbi:AAA family ATPase [Metallosphaera hakonensis JCM 8857 = DSM 7519]|uniref:ParA family protein n=1 Tax=Metallosphaera hakonensis JCM 8857 = DSM 7519 TaxID=1293036 RepID=A0A2U9IT61_9CREN|nr:AAA family ATPase [Metallosphaera hakonensis JCM 8857 = DSM 7519]
MEFLTSSRKEVKSDLRVVILGVKGGVGKSTIGLLLAKELCERGKRVLFVDRDQMGYASWIAGIKGKGLIASIVDEQRSDYFTEIGVGKGRLTVLKFYGDGFRLKKDLEVINLDQRRRELFARLYGEVLRLGHDVVILDNKSSTFPWSEEISLELMTYLKMFPGTPSFRIFITDPFIFNIENTISFARRLNDKKTGGSLPMKVIEQIMLINMVPFTKLEEIRNLTVGRDLFASVKLIPYFDQLFEFTGSVDKLPRLQEIKDIADEIERVSYRSS